MRRNTWRGHRRPGGGALSVIAEVGGRGGPRLSVATLRGSVAAGGKSEIIL